MKCHKNRSVALLLATTALSSLFGIDSQAFGQDATWRLRPGSFNFNTGANWSTGTVPTGTATFGASNRTLLLFSAGTGLEAISLRVDAPTYLFWLRGQDLTLSGAGIQNASLYAPVFANDGSINFVGSSTAANATIANILNGSTNFLDSSTAGGAAIANIEGGATKFYSASTAGAAAITTNRGGYTYFADSSTAGSATVTTNSGGNTIFADSTTAGSATLTTSSGGSTYFADSSTAGSATVTTSGTGQFDISPLSSGGLTAGSIAGDGRYLLGSKSLTVGSNNQSTTVSGSIEDGGVVGGTGGSLVKTGTGTLVLSGVNSYTGSTTVNAGALGVNGSNSASVLTIVNDGGTLGGTGTVGTTQIHGGGTLSPGNSIGTLTVNGNLAFGAGSTYAVEASPGAVDRTNVSGTATLAGTLRASFARGTYSARTYTLLSATGGRTGTFGTFSTAGLPGGFQTNLSYTSTDVMLNLTAALGGGLALSSNQGNVANALNTSFNSGNSLSSGLYGLFSMSGPPLANALNSLSGEAQTGAQTAAFTFGNQFLNTVLGSTGSGGLGGSLQQAVQYASLDANEAGPEPRRLRGWLAGFGGYGWLDGASGSSSVQTTTQGLAMGADWTFDGGTLGVAVASGSSNWFLASGLGSGLGNVLQIGLYGRTGAGPLYAAVAGGWGVHGVSTNRSVGFLGDFMSANYTVNTWSGRAEAGYRIALGDHRLTPFVAVQGQAANLPGFCETSRTGSGAALCFNANTATSLRSELGIEGDANLGTVLGSKARLQARLAWAHEYETTGTATAWFQSLPGSSFSVSGTPLPANVGLVRVLSDFELDQIWSLRLQGDAEFAGNYGSLAGTARIAARW
jgi:autotransporter-associated beta strand protein